MSWVNSWFNFRFGRAVLKKYLLEKSRIVSQAKHERNYHVFYQLLAGSTQAEKEEFNLATPDDYYYLNQVWKCIIFQAVAQLAFNCWNTAIEEREQRLWRRFSVFIAKTDFTHYFGVYIIDFVNSSWEIQEWIRIFHIRGILLGGETGFKWYILVEINFSR